MPDDGTVNFVLNLRLPSEATDATISPSTYWGIRVAKPTTPSDDPFADQERLLRVAQVSIGTAAQRAVKENDALGIPTPGRGEDGTIVHRLRGRPVTKEA